MLITTQNQKRGFTIVELLIVIVVIAILAAVSIVAYNGVQQRARDTVAKTSLAEAKKKLEIYKIDNSAYPATGSLASAEVTNDSNTTYEYTSDSATYCLTATVDGNTSWKATNTSSASSGGCAGHSVGGVAAITNLSVNPHATSAGTGFSNNNPATWSATKGVAVTGHPNGITTALRSKKISTTSDCILSSFNVDGLGNNPMTRTVGVWAYTEASGYQARVSTSAAFSPLPAGTWTYFQSSGGLTGWSLAWVCRQDGNPANLTDEAFITGTMAVEGTQNYSYADGNSDGWMWNGASGASTSTGQGF